MLVKNRLPEKLFSQVVIVLMEQGLILKRNDCEFRHYFGAVFHQEWGEEVGSGCASGEEGQHVALRL